MLMPTLGVFLIFNAGTHLSYLPFEVRRLVYIIVFVSTCLLPVSILPLFLQIKLIRSFRMENARERVYPALATGVFYLLGYFLITRLNISSLIEGFVLSSIVTIMIAVAVSRFWKISLHAIALGGVTGALVGIMLHYGIDLIALVGAMLLVSGLTMMARLFLNAHNPPQVYAGYAIGFLVVLGGVFFF